MRITLNELRQLIKKIIKEEITNENGLINASGNVVTGDYVYFKRAVFTGSYRNPKFSQKY
jgi:hypothetical protein